MLLMGGLVLSKIDPFYESLFFVGVITFLMRFLGLLIQDLDNPFGYYEGDSVEDVSLKPLDDVIARLREIDLHLLSSVVGERSTTGPNGTFSEPTSPTY